MPSPIKEYDVGLFCAIESTENTPVVMTGSRVQYATEMSFDHNESTVKRDYRSQARPLDVFEQAVLQHWAVSAKMPYAYSGTAGTPSPFEDIFRMCGAASVVSAGVSTTYARDTAAGHDSATIEMRTPVTNGTVDYRRRASGVRATLDISAKTGEDLVAGFSGVGKYYEPDEVAILVPTFTAQRNNIFGSPRPSNLGIRTLNNKALCLHSFSVSNFFGFKSEWLESMCKERAEPSTDDNGVITLQFEMPDWSSEFNPYTYADRTSIKRYPFRMVFGTVPGRILDLAVSEVQPQEPKEVILANKNRGMELKLNILHNPTITEK